MGMTWNLLLSQSHGIFNGILYSLGLISTYVNFITESTAMVWVAIAYSWHLAPLGAFFLLAALQTVPEDLYRSARMDGANVGTRFRLVTLPHITHLPVVVTLLTAMFSITAFDIFYIMTAGGPGTATQVLSYEIYFEQFIYGHYSYAAAISWILTILLSGWEWSISTF